MLFSEAILQYKGWKSFEVKANTVRGIEYHLRHLALYLRNPEIHTVTWGHLLEYLKDMSALGWTDNSFVEMLNSFRQFFKYWHKEDSRILDPEKIPKARRESKLPRVIDEESYKKILSVIGNSIPDIRNLAFINLLWDTGERRGENLSLNLKDLDLVNKKATIKTEKTHGKYREIFWTNGTNENLKKWIEVRTKWHARGRVKDPEALFIAIKGSHTGERIGKDAPNAFLKEYCLKAKIDVWNPHSFRHHMGHDIIEKGGSNADVAGILGHTSLGSTYIYTQLRNKELEKHYRKFKGD